MNISIAGRIFELHEKPKHRSVKSANNIMRDWALRNLPLDRIDPSKELDKIIQQEMETNRDIAISVVDINEALEDDQTIMLATGLTYQELCKLKDELYEDEHKLLLEKSKDAIRGSASDFLENSGTGSNSKPVKKPNRSRSRSATSENPVKSSSKTSGEPLPEKE